MVTNIQDTSMLSERIRRNFSRKETGGSVLILVGSNDAISEYINKSTEHIERLYFIGGQKMQTSLGIVTSQSVSGISAIFRAVN